MKTILTLWCVAITASFISPVLASEQAMQPDPQSSFAVTYFVSEPRCKTCHAIESLTRETVTVRFPEEIADGRLSFRIVDTDKEENQHYIDDFQLITKSVVLTEEKNGKVVRFRILQKVWELVHDPGEFEQYVAREIGTFMKKPSS